MNALSISLLKALKTTAKWYSQCIDAKPYGGPDDTGLLLWMRGFHHHSWPASRPSTRQVRRRYDYKHSGLDDLVRLVWDTALAAELDMSMKVTPGQISVAPPSLNSESDMATAVQQVKLHEVGKITRHISRGDPIFDDR